VVSPLVTPIVSLSTGAMALVLSVAACSASLAIVGSQRAARDNSDTQGAVRRIVALVVITLVTVGIVVWVVLMWGFTRDFRF
jgi:VIT1/CCC1 family predicted Fe2+/Mn2+ transporter